MNAQQLKLSGEVYDEQNKSLFGANLQLLEIKKSIVTDINGHFLFENLAEGNYTLVVKNIGYKTYTRQISVDADKFIKISLVPSVEQLSEVIVTAVRATKNMPVTYTNIGKKELSEKNLGQDVPFLLEQTPSVVVTSDAGAGVGYTGIRIRGVSSQQINVTLNGIPLNDPESHSVYWVDIPDFAASTSGLQIQRGVGTSTFGTGAFGASINLETDRIKSKAFSTINTSYGSFNTKKISLKGSTGLLKKHFEFTGRYSKITSDGYRDRATSNLNSYYFSGAYKDDKTTLKALIFGGHEITYQAWYGIDKQTFEETPISNPTGAIYDENWNIVDYYDNQVDDYKQDHYQLHFERKIAENLKFNLAAHYTYGRGYYEQYKQNQDFKDYGLDTIYIDNEIITKTDLIRRKWLDNDFYGLAGSFQYGTTDLNIILGAAVNQYDGKHFGKIIWAQYASNSKINHKYYDNLGVKKFINVFAKANYKLMDDLNLFADVQFRSINYAVNGTMGWNAPWKTSDDLFFINPKLGLYYKLDENNDLYLSVAQSHREPNRDDYENTAAGKPKPEVLNNIETGWKFDHKRLKAEVNLFGMFYRNQLVYTGAIDNVGAPIRKNVGESRRVGMETQIAYRISSNLSALANFTWSDNRNINYVEKESNILKKYGDTFLTYSPNIVAAGSMVYQPLENLKLQWNVKYVGKQYMDNKNSPASKLDAYHVHNLVASYKIQPKKYLEQAQFIFTLNNFLNKKYASNGYMWDGTPYYFPQAGRHFLMGVSLTF